MTDDYGNSIGSKWRVQFIPKIDLGHVLTIVAMSGALVTVYSSFDKRLAIAEEANKTGQIRATEKETQWKESLLDLKIDVKELQRSINEINRNIRPVDSPRR